MKKHLVLLLLLLVPAFSFAQEEDEIDDISNYPSKEKDAYYQEWEKNYKPWKPLDENEIMNYTNGFFEIKKTRHYTRYTPSNNDFPYYFEYLKTMFESGTDSIGGIDLRQILKYEKKGTIEAVVYKSGKYENYYSGEPGIWIAYSQNSGESWEYYYTGIVQGRPLFMKGDTETPLFKDNGDLQIECCLLRQMTPTYHPGPGATYKLVKDGLLLTVDLATLRKDSDNDGLTDIVEAKFFTNPNNADSDGDGITDDLDLNPRMAMQRTDKTLVYEIVLNGEMNDTILFTDNQEVSMARENASTVLIVTDDPNLQAVQPKFARVIVLSQKEFEEANRYSDMLKQWRFSPLFKVDDQEDMYIFSESLGTGGSDLVAKRVKNGWVVYAYSFWIS